MPSDWVLRGMRAALAPLLIMAAGAVVAQSPRPVGSAVDPMRLLVEDEQVRAELQIDSGQLNKLRQIVSEFHGKQSELLRQMGPGASPEQTNSARITLRMQTEEARGKIAQTLTRSQLQRFEQMLVKLDDKGGPSMLPREEVAPVGLEDLPGGGRPNADPMQILINSRQLQEELQMDEGQIRKLRRIEPEFRSKQSELLQQMAPGASPEQARSARMMLQAHMEVARGMVARVLTRRQLERFQQIMVQIEGVCSALRDENVARSLGLQPVQMREVTSLCRRMHASIKPPPPGGSPAERCAAMGETRIRYEKAKEQTEGEIVALLSDGQRSALRSMAGRPFQMDPPNPPECR